MTGGAQGPNAGKDGTGLQDPSEYLSEQMFTGVTATLHERYVPGATYDVAVIRLPRPLRFNDYVQPVCLPSSPAAPGTNCIATGWGATKGKYSQGRLRHINDGANAP